MERSSPADQSSVSPHENHSVRQKVEDTINQIIEHCSVCYFTGLPFTAPVEDILLHHSALITPRQMQIIYALIQTREVRSDVLRYIYDHLSKETLLLFLSICTTNGYVDCRTRTKLAISVLVGFTASPANHFFRPFAEEFPARWNTFYSRLLHMPSSRPRLINHDHVSSSTLVGGSIVLNFSQLGLFSHMCRPSSPSHPATSAPPPRA